MITFGMGLHIPEEELDICHELAITAYLNLGLTNDLYSWQKEYETAVALGQDYVVNVISVLMEEHSIPEAEAKAMCREKIKVTIIDFRKIVEDTNERIDISLDTKKYLEALLYSLSGNLVWSLECPRYHAWASYNEQQLDWMKNGIPKTGKPSTNGAIHQNGSAEPKTIKTIGIGNKAVTFPDSKLANASNGWHTSNGESPLGNGMIDTSLVNVFATKKINGLDGVKLHDENVIPPSSDIKLHLNVVLEGDMEDLDSKVS